MDPLTRYRRAQRETRRLFDPFTREHCPTCSTPCCRKPARIRPVDLILVEELGYRVPGGAAERLVDSSLSGYTAPCEDAGAPCDYLGSDGCSFPADLRPFGCVAFICEPMRRLLPADDLTRVEAAVADLERAHGLLMEALHAAPASGE
jgi:hypothetical protein